jgi:hypothetical protein
VRDHFDCVWVILSVDYDISWGSLHVFSSLSDAFFIGNFIKELEIVEQSQTFRLSFSLKIEEGSYVVGVIVISIPKYV